jgi:flagella basal body P-ring formation protein FlgA
MLPVNKSFHRPLAAWARALWRCALPWALLPGAALADAVAPDVWARDVETLARRTEAPAGGRIEVEIGSLDPRLTLAPCARITPYLPAGARLWGHARVGLRCDEGARWNVFVPVTVKVFAPAWSAVRPLLAGTVVDASHLALEEVDLAAEPGAVIPQPAVAIGRTLVRSLRAGQALRETDLKPRQWFAAGDTVRILSVGRGFAISADGQALNPGIEGQLVKVRTEGGRVVSGRPVGERRIEVLL